MAGSALYGRLMRGLSHRAGFRLFRFFERDLTSSKAREPEGLGMRLLSERDALALCAHPDLDLREDAVRAAYARGDVCVGAFAGEDPAGYCWLAFEPLQHLDGVSVAFGRSVVWTYKSLVRPSQRGKGVAAALYRFGDAACLERGRKTSVICVESHNTASVRAAERAGYASAGFGAYIVRPAAVLYWASARVRALGIAFSVAD